MNSFLDVVLNYTPVLIFVLVMNVRGIACGLGSRPMMAGLLIMAAAAAVQAAGIDALSPLDRNGPYHVICMIGAGFLYAGGLRLKVS